MATYAQNAHRREVLARRRGADARDRELHRAFDLIAQDNVAKSERPRFAVVGEGSRSAQDAYRRNYDRIFPPRARYEVPPYRIWDSAFPDGATFRIDPSVDLSSRRDAPSASAPSSGTAVAAG